MNLKTREEQQDVLAAIDTLVNNRYKTKNLDRKINPRAHQLIELEAAGRSVSEVFLKDLKKRVAALPALSLTLAFPPPAETLVKISAWLKTNIAKDLLIDLVVDERLLGGAQVAYQGHYKDYSLAKKLKER